MSKTKKTTQSSVKWRKAPREDDYPRAESFLRLIYPPEKATELIQKLREAKLEHWTAKDIFRATGTRAETENLSEQKREIAQGELLSPILMVRQPTLGKLLVADGFHRLCAVHAIDEQAVIAAKLV